MNCRFHTMRARAHRALTTWASLAVLVGLGGCGPGTGGSGDGEHARALQMFGASAASVCNSALSNVLACASANAPDSNFQGTQMVLFSDTQAGNNVAVAISGNQLELSARCQNMRFAGDWGITAQNDARFFGTYTAPGQATPAPASLTVQTATPSSSSGGEVFALLRSLDGRVLLGPVLLQRVPNPVSNPAACPS